MLHCCSVAQVVWQGQPLRNGKPCGCPLRKELEGGANGICRQVRMEAVSPEMLECKVCLAQEGQCSLQQRSSEGCSSLTLCSSDRSQIC